VKADPGPRDPGAHCLPRSALQGADQSNWAGLAGANDRAFCRVGLRRLLSRNGHWFCPEYKEGRALTDFFRPTATCWLPLQQGTTPGNHLPITGSGPRRPGPGCQPWV